MSRDDQDTRRWQPPPKDALPGAKMGWVNDVVAAGEGNLTAQTGFKDIGRAVDLISGRLGELDTESRSKLTTNRGKRVLREVIANISDIRPVDCYTSDNRAYQEFLAMLNKVWKAVYFESRFPATMKKAVQWFAAGGYSFISPVYRNLRLNSTSGRAIVFDAFSMADCIPFQLPENNDVQGAYAWTIIRYMPQFEAHAKFPKFQHKLRPIARRRYVGNAAKDRIALAERFRADNLGTGTTMTDWTQQMNEIRYMTVRDLSINTGKMPVAMGEPGSLESYVVPFVGQEIPTGQMNQGVRIMRKTTEEDCYLYPNLRCFITQRGMDTPMYDGPFFDIHGMHPLARFSADEWPWEPGYSLAREIFSIEETRQSFERGIDMTAKARFDPSMIYDNSSGLNRKTMENFDPYKERGRLGVDGGVDEKTIRPALPAELLNVPGWGFQWTKYLDDSEDYLLGMSALSNLAKAKVASGGDAMEKAMEEAGPIVKDVSHSLERPMADLMEMVLYDVLQYYPTGRIMQYVGPDGVSKETFDLDPASLVPSHGPDENAEDGNSVYTRMQRVKMFCSNIHAQITPGSLHGVVQTEQRLLYMQLQRAGFMIDSETVAKAMNIPNWGTLEGNTVRAKWESEQKMKLEFAAKMRELGTSLTPPGAAAPSPGAGGKAKPGRPPSGNRPPELKSKGSAEGPRAVISESG